ncbi:unnamed protein product [Adineta steineri]|uniref:Phosphoglycerate mutase-like protein n=1 Tax=Adineta steineri TaxID=433720 RepID=A0A819E8P9_9BILA|nr:unnamed protein product [Adineta steineri]CAF1196516.1 unnamed protein product [Adineta steineri]CAF3725611.1 unnamed protein product [Adineta steineri]CAF3847395.1 unnamed protein product [Adineta steineri]
MTMTSNDIDLLHIDEDLELDSTSSNSHVRIHSPLPLLKIPVKSTESLNFTVRSRHKSKTLSKKRTLTRYIFPRIPSRTESLIQPLDYYEPDNYYHHHYYHHHHHHHQQQPQQQLQQQQGQSNEGCDMRFFIIRHGERVDRYFGSNWFMLAFDNNGQYRPYHVNYPPDLPPRPNKYFWALDTPLTRDGLNAAQNVGRVLGLNQFEPTYVYSSPAMRCIFTTFQILKGLGLENKLSIRIEPGLLELGAARFGMSFFLTPIEWYNYGINVDLTYQPIMQNIDPLERESAYYLRSKYIIRQIEQIHNNNSSPSSLNILLVGHATSPETLTWDLVGRQPNVYDLFTLSLNIGYLQMVITEREKQTKAWSLTQMPLQSTTLKWV